MHRQRRRLAALLPAAACLAGAVALAADTAPRTVPAELATALSAAQDDLRAGRADEAVRRLSAYAGQDHALRHLLIGHARVQQSDLPAATEAYRAALRMDGDLEQAGIALAQVLARRGQWTESVALLGRFVRAETCQPDVLLLYAQAARQLGDARLGRLLVEKAVVRFPADGRFRRLALALDIDRGDYLSAAATVRALLRKDPADADLWQQRAFLADQTGAPAEAAAASEAAVLCDPNDLNRHRRLLAALLAAQDHLSVIRRGRSLLAGPMAAAAKADVALMDLLIRAADLAEDDGLLGEYLAAVPEAAQTRAMRIVTARRAVRLGRPAEARQALARLIEAGETDAGVYLWSGHLAEREQDWPEAETLYRQARRRAAPPARMASLYLARLYLRRGRVDESARLLNEYLDLHPEDSAVRAMLAVVADRQGRAP